MASALAVQDAANVVASQLVQTIKHATSLRLALRASINIADDLSNRHADLLRHSGELSAAADRLQEEEAMLTRHAEEIGTPLQHYDAVDRIGVLVGVLFRGKTTVRGLAKIKVDHDDYPRVLEEIDDALAYFGRECGGMPALEAELKRVGDKLPLESGSLEYFRRALALQDAALYLVKEAVADRITATAKQVSDILKLSSAPVSADQLEASLIYTRFHGISSRSNRLISLVRSRAKNRHVGQHLGGAWDGGETAGTAYQELLQLCRSTYCASREGLLRLTVESHMDKLKRQHGPVGMTRLASVFLVRLCTVETSLYVDFFCDSKMASASSSSSDANGSNDGKGGGDGDRKKSALIGPALSLGAQVMATDGTLYDAEFQTYLTSLCNALHKTVRRSLVTMNDLDTLCQIVGVLREERTIASSSPTTMAAARAITSVIKDAQERLIFCANSTLNREVVRFKPTPRDLDYPDKLVKKHEGDASVPPVKREGKYGVDDDDAAVEQQLQMVYESWFPPMRSVLKILSKVFRVVEPKVFEDMALQSVQACTRCLRDGAEYIKKRSGVLDSDLFLVKHLLILREQLSPFDIELRSVERQLDFSDAGKAVARFLANRNRRLFSMSSTENALITLLREGVSVQESSVDSKRDLENALKAACNDYMDHCAHAMAGALLGLADQCRAAEAGSLAQHALLNADHFLASLDSARAELDASVDAAVDQLRLYLENPGTQGILLKPVSRKVVRAAEDLTRMLGTIADGQLDWDPDKRSKAMECLTNIEAAAKRIAKTSVGK